MIDLTPLDVRKKRGDFKKTMRGYLPEEVDTFLDLTAMRLEELVKENMGLRERVERLQIEVEGLSGRERAVQDALVTAQTLREDMREQSRREAELALREAEVEAKRMMMDADRQLEERRSALDEIERKRVRFLRAFRALLERELDVVVVEEGRSPLGDNSVELELSGGRSAPDAGDGRDDAEPEDDGRPRGTGRGDRRSGPGELWLSGLAESPDAPRPEG